VASGVITTEAGADAAFASAAPISSAGAPAAGAGLSTGESLAVQAGLSGISSAYGEKMKSDAVKEQERMQMDQQNRMIAAQRATPLTGYVPQTAKIVSTPWDKQGTAPATVQTGAPQVSQVGTQNVSAQEVGVSGVGSGSVQASQVAPQQQVAQTGPEVNPFTKPPTVFAV